MELDSITLENYTKYPNKIFLVTNIESAKSLDISEQALAFLAKKSKDEYSAPIQIETLEERIFIVSTEKVDGLEAKDGLRSDAYSVLQACNKAKLKNILLVNNDVESENAYAFLEGIYLSSYSFQKYKSKKKELSVEKISIVGFDKGVESEIIAISNAVFKARDFVNEPIITLTAPVFAEQIKAMFEGTSAIVNVYDKSWIESQKMGGLLAVNKGSVDEPRFVHIKWAPNKSQEKPIVLVGKGIVYDTGGLSLKPSQFMEHMKADMGGAAAVVGTIKSIVDLDIQINVDVLIPITDNRPGGNAYAPGDVITMRSGLTVEVLNTDAEGRMVLADALDYAKEFNPELVVDMATLTGAAQMTVGDNAAVYMGTATKEIMTELEEISLDVWEPLVKLPIFNYYDKLIQSDIADIKNVGGPHSGSITAGKFLQRFTDYPWVHMDISGSAFLKTKSTYKGVGGTGFGIRTMYAFLKSKAAMDV